MALGKDFYESKITDLEHDIDELTKISSRLSFLRLLFFILSILFLITGLVKQNTILLILSIVSFGLFLYEVFIHSRIKKQVVKSKALVQINKEYLYRIECDFENLTDKGIDFKVDDHDYAFDLDIFGNTSLFARFNVSDNYFGRKAFADKLLTAHAESFDSIRIKGIQEAVKELAQKPEFLINYQAVSRLGNLKNVPYALINITKNKENITKPDSLILRLQPLLWMIPLVGLFTRYFTATLMITFILNLILWFLVEGKYNKNFKKADGISKQAKTLSELYKLVDCEEFRSGEIKSLIGSKGDVYNKVSVLSKVLNLVSLRSQPMFALILNSLVPFDYWCTSRINKWIDDNGTDVAKAVINLGELESMMSAACVEIVADYCTYPEFIEGAYFNGSDIYHPLINPDTVVSNSVLLNSQTAIITGSNMSGKTTLIRTVGVCAILSYLGAAVPAKSLSLSHMRIMTSMRIVDSLESNMSTFRAELVKIAKIVKFSEEGKSLLFLIDEIFRGTNSADRTDGAYSVLKKFAKTHISGMMTTHDYALCDKVKDEMNNIVYYHFSEKYNNEDIIFDYKLKDGISNESNAKYLMRLVGITD